MKKKKNSDFQTEINLRITPILFILEHIILLLKETNSFAECELLSVVISAQSIVTKSVVDHIN